MALGLGASVARLDPRVDGLLVGQVDAVGAHRVSHRRLRAATRRVGDRLRERLGERIESAVQLAGLVAVDSQEVAVGEEVDQRGQRRHDGLALALVEHGLRRGGLGEQPGQLIIGPAVETAVAAVASS